MSLPVFPPELDKPMRDSFRLGTGETRRLFQPDAAPIAPRARYSQAARPVDMVLILDRNKLAIFDNFYVDTLANGARPFLMPDPITDGWPLLDAEGNPMLTGEGEPILLAATWVCLFGQALPDRKPYGIEFTVAFNLSVMP